MALELKYCCFRIVVTTVGCIQRENGVGAMHVFIYDSTLSLLLLFYYLVVVVLNDKIFVETHVWMAGGRKTIFS